MEKSHRIAHLHPQPELSAQHGRGAVEMLNLHSHRELSAQRRGHAVTEEISNLRPQPELSAQHERVAVEERMIYLHPHRELSAQRREYAVTEEGINLHPQPESSDQRSGNAAMVVDRSLQTLQAELSVQRGVAGGSETERPAAAGTTSR